MRRLINWFKALFNRMMNRLEDPDMMLDQARREMQETLQANKERAIQAITQRNNLQAMVEDHERKTRDLEAKAVQALKMNNRDLARQLLREKATYETTLESLKQSLAQANETVESVKVAIRRQEEETRKRTADALAMKAQYKQAQIETELSKALDQFSVEYQFGTFEAAAERIRTARSEASARQELAQATVQGKMTKMEDMALDAAAEEELQALEARLGLAPASDQTTEATPALDDVDAQLDELEKRLNQGQNPQS
jgi:phage shock protein A